MAFVAFLYPGACAAVRRMACPRLEAKPMRTPLKTTVSVLFYIDAFIWLIGVIPTLYYASTHEACRPWGDKADGRAFLVARH